MRNTNPKNRAQSIVTVYGDYTVAIVGDMDSHDIYVQPSNSKKSIWKDIEGDWAGYGIKTNSNHVERQKEYEGVRFYGTDRPFDNKCYGMDVGEMVDIAFEEFETLTKYNVLTNSRHLNAFNIRDTIMKMANYTDSPKWLPPFETEEIENFLTRRYGNRYSEIGLRIGDILSYGGISKVITTIVADECYFIEP